MKTTLPDIDLASYSVIIKKIRLIFVNDTCLISKRYVSYDEFILKTKRVLSLISRILIESIVFNNATISKGINAWRINIMMISFCLVKLPVCDNR